jgi:hypothetical protein
MQARLNLIPEKHPATAPEILDQGRRNALRYHFAELLTLESFEEAWHESEAAFHLGEIKKEDLQFVLSIIKSAKRLGRPVSIEWKDLIIKF